MLELNIEHIRKELESKSHLKKLITTNTQHYDELR